MLSFQRKSLSFESALSYLQAFTGNSNTFLWKRNCLLKHFNSLCEVNGVMLHFLNALLFEKITLFWNCLKLLTSIHKKLTSVSLKEKQSVPHTQPEGRRSFTISWWRLPPEKTTFRKWCNTPFTSHSELKCWNRLLLFHKMHVSFLWMLVSSLRHFQRKVIFSERTVFRKWSNTPFTSHS